MPLQRLGRYELLRVLGRGAMGVVYEARDPNLERRVAIKTIRMEDLGGAAELADYEARFRAEARSAARLQHPNIVSVYDSDRDGDVAFLVMEFVEGRTQIPPRPGPALQPGGNAQPHQRPARRTGLFPPPGRGAPRHQAGQPAYRKLRPAQAHRLRSRPHPGRRRRHPHCQRHGGHAEIHGPRTGAGQARGCAQRPVLRRRGALPAAHRPAALRRRQ
ncbi:MAG: protein kinase [Burkholderiaceae bacterium]|nr:MAG: protein kinase [Burkholderiaceae bacterium]